MGKTVRKYYFDNLKGFLIICVIIGNSLELANPTSVNVHTFILLLYIFHMPMFAFVSGYFSKISKRSTKERVIDTTKLYLSAQIFYTFFNFLILKKSSVRLELLMPQWTLWYLLSMIFWYIISDYILDYKKWLMGSVCLSLIIGLDGSIGTIASVSRTVFFLPFFIIGRTFKEDYIEKLKKHKSKFVILTIVVLISLIKLSDETPIELLFEYTNYTWYFEKPWFPMFIRVFHYISSIIIGGFILTVIPIKITNITILGENSLIMYISHSGIVQLLLDFDIIKYNSLFSIVISTLIVILTVIIFTLIIVNVRLIKRKVS
ncbi:acyltransferase family protein [Clostridium septicum]|uniref:acyltransferase family protein n=1 Tax=Clostridium septicum TaxID=1504 RepID=UPI00272E56FE|nr:acyltransferase family protein [Clostridium septicum]WLF70583.1 acyltransferase family protein [Clostridium septicum]